MKEHNFFFGGGGGMKEHNLDVTLLISLNDTKTMIVNVCLNIDGVT